MYGGSQAACGATYETQTPLAHPRSVRFPQSATVAQGEPASGDGSHSPHAAPEGSAQKLLWHCPETKHGERSGSAPVTGSHSSGKVLARTWLQSWLASTAAQAATLAGVAPVPVAARLSTHWAWSRVSHAVGFPQRATVAAELLHWARALHRASPSMVHALAALGPPPPSVEGVASAAASPPPASGMATTLPSRRPPSRPPESPPPPQPSITNGVAPARSASRASPR